MSIIKVENLSLKYSPKTPFEKTALDNVSFEINKGDFVGIIGHTGSGKSSLVQTLNGLIKPTKGKVYFDDKDIWSKKDIRQIRFNVGLVFQYPEYQLFEETVYKDIAFGPKNMGLDENEVKKRVYSALRFVSLEESILDKSPFEISGGEKRRVAIAGVIAMEPEVLILDEPTAGLDPVGRDLLLSQIENYHRTRKNTVLLVSHSMEDVARSCEKVLVINDGKVYDYDETSKVFSKGEQLKSIGLEIPEITYITEELIKNGINLPKGILTVEKAALYISELLKKEGKL